MSNVVRLEYAYGVCPKCKSVHYLRYLIHNDGLIHKPYEIKCINCNSYYAKEDILGSGEETAPKPTTNYDSIRAMSIEEIATWRASGQCPPLHYYGDYDCINQSCENCWIKWLQEPCDDNSKEESNNA